MEELGVGAQNADQTDRNKEEQEAEAGGGAEDLVHTFPGYLLCAS